MKAKYPGRCARCGLSFPEGTELGKLPPPHYGWGHATCPGSLEEAQRQADKVVEAKKAESRVPSIVTTIKGTAYFTVPHPYDEGFVSTVKQVEGRRWDGDRRMWLVPVAMFDQATSLLGGWSPEYGARMRDDGQFAAAREAADAVRERREASRAATSDEVVPVPEGLAYLPYQLAGIAFARGLLSCLIGDEMGLGKTIQALGLINLDGPKHVLVVCPASLRPNWHRECQKWLVTPHTYTIVDGKRANLPTALDKRHVVIINYDVLKSHHEWIHSREWDLLIVDEAHYLKNPKAQRTAEVFGKWDRDPNKARPAIKARRRLFLTGTPIPNRPVELWPLVQALDPGGLGRSWKRFVERYCAGQQVSAGRAGMVWDVSGASHLDELQDRMRGSFLLRRRKADVLKELPPKRRQLLVLPANGAFQAIRAEQAASKAAEERELELRVKVAMAKAAADDQSYEDAVAELHAAQQAAFTEMSRLRHETARAKVPHVIEHVIDTAASVGQVVLFAHHRDVIDALRAGLEEAGLHCATLTGDTPMDQRQEAIDTFQAGSVDVFIGNIQAAGVGITLTASSHVVFAELDWVPGNITQAEDRCHRIGQENSVTVQHVVLEGSLDEHIAQMLIDKQAVQDAALDDVHDRPEVELPEPEEEPVTERFLVDLAEELRDRYQRREEREAKRKEKAAVEAAKRSEVLRMAKVLTNGTIVAIHECLRSLAVVCDGAFADDRMGFNAVDTGVGRLLGYKPAITPEEAALGQMIIRKYRGQLEAYGAPYHEALRTTEDA